jgi:hypothetical protein
MTPTRIAVVICGAILVADGISGESPRRVQRLQWISGCWEERSAGSTVEEFWTTPNGGILFGVGRTIARRAPGDTTTSFEVMRIFERDGRLVFAAQPSGQELAEFTEQELTDSSVVFANPTHDFPQFVRYRRGGGNELQARVDGEMNGKPEGFDSRYRRVACPGSRPSGA